MGVIANRDCGKTLADLARTTYDVVVIGGGIHGAMLHLEASRCGLRSLLVERDDFGGATSASGLRVVDGGLRHLMSLNVARSVESARERQWYLASMPRLVAPLPCLLPVYAHNGRSPRMLKLGLGAAGVISAAVRYADCALADVPAGHFVHSSTVTELAPGIRAEGLAGGAVWHDLALRCPGRVIVETLRWAADLGGVAVNYVEARDLLMSKGKVQGVIIGTTDGHDTHELIAPVVINAAGPWAGELAARWHLPDVMLAPLVVAWNVLLDRPPLSGHAVALQDPLGVTGRLLLATSLGGRLFIGTGYTPLGGRACGAAESIAEAELGGFLATANRCIPSLAVTRRDVLRLYCSVLPAAASKPNVPRSGHVIRRHEVRGLFSVSGTTFTTARSVAQQAIAALRRSELRWSGTPQQAYPPCHVSAADGLFGNEWTMRDVELRRAALERIVRQEAVEHLDDLVLRRTTLGDQPARALAAARALCTFDERWRVNADREAARLAARLHWRQAAWAMNKSGTGFAAVAKTA
jgi:glycerol-3-phosphate dehydrogenase